MQRDNSLQSLLVDSVWAHTWRFERPLNPTYGDAAGTRMLAAFLIVGVALMVALRSMFDSAGVRGLPLANLVLVVALLAAFFVTQRAFVAIPVDCVGLRPLAAWTRRERLFFLQATPLAAIIFAIVFGDHLQALVKQHGVAGFLLFSVFSGFIWGMIQEFFYRGWLQTELTRRFGAAVGLLAANAVFTLGPLHSNYLFVATSPRWGGLVAVFGIGLLFGVLYWRSGNLWIPAVMHGLWPLNMS